MSANRGSWDGSKWPTSTTRRTGVTFCEPQRHSTGEVPTSKNPPPRPPRLLNVRSDSGNSEELVSLTDPCDAIYSVPPKVCRPVPHTSLPRERETAMEDAYDSFVGSTSDNTVIRRIPSEYVDGGESKKQGIAIEDEYDTFDYSQQNKTVALGGDAKGGEINYDAHDIDDVDGAYSLQDARDWVYAIPQRKQHDSKGVGGVYSIQDAYEWEYAVPGQKRLPMVKQRSLPENMLDKQKQSYSIEVTMRQDSGRLRTSGKQASPLTMRHFSNVTEDKVKVILELKSPDEGAASSSRAPMRLVCLFDISGSMSQKCGLKRADGKHRETKLTKMTNVAKILTKTLEDEDHLGILAFGSDVDVIFPLTKLEGQAKKEAFTTVRKLGKSGLSVKTNLSKGLLTAIDMFRNSSRKTGSKYLETRDVIVVLTDGELNEGITDGQALVKEVRQAIRDFEMESRHYCKDPSLTISTVVTGSEVSEAVYLLSKTCGNDAYYYIDRETDATEVAAMMPVLLRKTSVASSISVKVEALDPAELLPKLCSHEYMAHRPHDKDDEINYFIHDLGWGMSKHLSIVLDKDSVFCENDPKAVVLRVHVEYKDRLLNKQSLIHTVTRRDIEGNVPAANVAVCIQDVRRISQIALRNVADWLKADDAVKAVAQLDQCKVDVKKELQKYAKLPSEKSDMANMTAFIESVVSNLGNLLTVIEDSNQSTGHKWSTVKAVSSAIVRETPSVPELIVQEENMYNTKSVAVELSELRNYIRNHYKTLGVESVIFGDYDQTIKELHNTLPRYDPEMRDDAADRDRGANSTPSEQRNNDGHMQRASAPHWSDDDEYTYSSNL